MRTTATFDALCAPLDDVAASLGARDGDVSALATELSALAIIVDDRKEEVSEPPRLRGVVLRAFDGEGFQEYATDGAPRTELLRAARRLGRLAKRNGVARPSASESFETRCEVDPADVPLEEKSSACVSCARASARSIRAA